MNAVELFWISVNVVGLSLTVWALRDAQRNVVAVRSLNGAIVGVAARGNLFREQLRFVIQTLFLAVGILSATDGREATLTLPAALLLMVPVLIVVNTLSEMRDRHIIVRKSDAAISAERDRRMDRLEAQGHRIEVGIAANTVISQGARDDAREAATAANSVNEKIADHGATLVEQGTAQAEDRKVGRDTNETAHRIDERVP